MKKCRRYGRSGPRIHGKVCGLCHRQDNSSLLNNLLAYYSFNVSLTQDDTGNGNTLTNHSVTSGTGVNGNDATFVRASSQYLSLSSPAASFRTLPMSWSFWFKAVDTTNSIICSIFGGSPNNCWEIRYNARIRVTASSDGSSAGTTSTATAQSIATWHHCVITIDLTSGSCLFYIDGVADSGNPHVLLGAATQFFSGTISPFLIGADAVGGGGTTPATFWNGQIDELGIWSVVLTPTQVSSLYGSGTPPTYPFTGIT